MACSNCNTPSCGCSGTYVVSQTCPPACSEVFNSSCIVYTGVDLTCPDNTTGVTSTVISRNDYLDTALTKIINYFCSRFNSLVIPTTVVESDDPAVVVVEQTVGSITTYLLSLDPTQLPSASQVTAGDNVVVTGTGAALDPYVINANESIVAVDAASALTLIVDPSTPGPYETTYTIGIDSSLLPITELQSGEGHILITPIPNTPNTGDTTYNLEVPEVQITSLDTKIDIVNTNSGYVAPYERTFTVDVNETEMGNYVMDTAAGILAQGGIIADPGSAITVGYDALTHTITIGESIGAPFQWQTISDGVTDVIAASVNDKLRIVADAVANGISSTLATGPGANEATFTLVNEDRGSAQNIFGTIDCNNGGPSVGTCLAGSNIDTLTLVGGDDITLGVTPGNVITINNDIDHVYSDVIADSGGALQAGSTTSTLEIKGDTDRISTSGAMGANAEVTVTFNGVVTDASLTGDGTTATPLTVVAQNKWATFTADDGSSTTANTSADTLDVNGSKGISTSIVGDTLNIENTGAKFTTLDATISGGNVTVPAGGSVDVSGTGISSVYMNVQLVTAAGVIVPHDNTRWLIKDMGAAPIGGPGTFTFENVALADGDYVLTITGNL